MLAGAERAIAKITKISMFTKLFVIFIPLWSLGSLVGRPAQTPAARPRITGISHIALRVTDSAAARRFYTGILGLTEGASTANGRMSYLIGSHQRVVVEGGLPAGEDERLSHLAFETADVKALASYLTSRGMEIAQPAQRCDPAAIWVIDPDGHPIEFMQTAWPLERAEARPGNALSVRLLHVGLTVRDEQNAHRFYRDVLGFSEIWRGGRPEGVTQWVNMRVPDGTDYLEYMLITSAPDPQQRGSLHHLALLVPDIQAAWEEVGRRSTTIPMARMSPPNVGVNGRWQLNLFDPDGTRTELMEPFRVR
jgi:catechol 2,3-dioxygenase-like lactoylglutathione lyase family enzyme